MLGQIGGVDVEHRGVLAIDRVAVEAEVHALGDIGAGADASIALGRGLHGRDLVLAGAVGIGARGATIHGGGCLGLDRRLFDGDG